MISANYLKQVILDQQKRISKLQLGYPRSELELVKSLIKHKINIVVTGHRRSGKSTFLLQWMNKYYNGQFYYFDFSDDRIVGFGTEDLQQLYELFLELFGNKKIFFFDELQGKFEWNKFVNRLYSEGYRFFITGSNADLLSKEISTYLTGRHKDLLLYPFSFKEFLGYNKYSEDIRTTEGKAKAKRLFSKYLENGGFPEVVVYGDRAILNEVYNDVINKDILSRYDIREESTFKKIALFLISNFAKEFSYTSLKNNFQLGSVHTAKNYASYLSNAYLLFEVNKYDYSFKNQETYAKKIYCIDHGLINELTFSFSENKGRLFENVVFIELLRKNKKVYYWKDDTNREVDFLIVDKTKVVELIQVCYNLEEKTTKEREVASLIKAMAEFKLKKGFILTEDFEKIETHGGKKINFVPLWKWLLQN